MFVTQFWTPMEVKQVMGYALYLAQTGSKHPDAKPLAGFGSAGVVEVVDDFVRSTYRAVYTVRLQGVVLRAPCLPEEVEEGEPKTPRGEIELVKRRLQRALEIHAERVAKPKGESK